jgi:hypothetical protein
MPQRFLHGSGHQGIGLDGCIHLERMMGVPGCQAETFRLWVRQAECEQGKRPGPTTSETERIKARERENRALRQVNDIVRKPSAFFAEADLDRRRSRAAECPGLPRAWLAAP